MQNLSKDELRVPVKKSVVVINWCCYAQEQKQTQLFAPVIYLYFGQVDKLLFCILIMRRSYSHSTD